MELAKWLVHWTLNLASRVQCSPRTIHIIHRMTPGKATEIAKFRILHDKIVCARSCTCFALFACTSPHFPSKPKQLEVLTF